MNVLLFGATGMIGEGVLKACLDASDVERVLSISRKPSGYSNAKLEERFIGDMLGADIFPEDVSSFDACYFCVGVSSAGMNEADYTKVTYDVTLNVANQLLGKNPNLAFVFVSGTSADSSEKGRVMWARVKGKTENAILKMPFKQAFVFRPAAVQPMDGIKVRVAAYVWIYRVLNPFFPLLRRIWPSKITSTREIGAAMIQIAKSGYQKRLLENHDINVVAATRHA